MALHPIIMVKLSTFSSASDFLRATEWILESNRNRLYLFVLYFFAEVSKAELPRPSLLLGNPALLLRSVLQRVVPSASRLLVYNG